MMERTCVKVKIRIENITGILIWALAFLVGFGFGHLIGCILKGCAGK